MNEQLLFSRQNNNHNNDKLNYMDQTSQDGNEKLTYEDLSNQNDLTGCGDKTVTHNVLTLRRRRIQA